ILSQADVEKFMDKKVATATTERMVEEAAEYMRTNNLRVLPIVDENKKVQGIVTYKDILKAIIDLSGYTPGDEGSSIVVKVVEDRVGVLSDITKVLADASVSVSHIFVNDEDGIEITIQVHAGQGDNAKAAIETAGYEVVTL